MVGIRKIIIFTLVVFIFYFVASSALALEPLVPCGREGTPPCTTCDILVLGKNISDFILFYLVPALAALFFIYAGFLILLGGGIPSRVAAGQNIFRTTAYGLMIIFLAWLIVNTVLRTVAGDSNIAEEWWKLECKEVVPTTTTTTTTMVTTTLLPGSSTTTVTGGGTTTITILATTTTQSGATTTTKPPGSTTSTLLSSTTTTVKPTTTTIKPSTTTTTVAPTTTTARATTTTTSTALACMFQGVNYSTFNICSGLRRPGGCGTSSCSQYLSSINKYAGGAATASVLKAFMVIESDCNPTRVSYDGSSFGLMQFKPETAGDFKRNCGMGTQTSCTAAGGTWGSSSAVGRCNVTGSWLTNPTNADKSICLAAAYINSIAAGSCGSSPGGIYAGYNAGAGWCGKSSDCSSQQSCAGGATKMWECPYDNPQHTTCNEGLYQTKQGASYINYCMNNLGF